MSVVLSTSMSVDGYVVDPGDDLDDGFDDVLGPAETGAVIIGRRTFERAGAWSEDHPGAIPVFVLTRTMPAGPGPGHARFVTDLGACVTEAEGAAGDRDVMVHGAATGRSILCAGLVDELAIRLVPLLLGQGRRLFDDLPPERQELVLLQSIAGPGALLFRYRVEKRR